MKTAYIMVGASGSGKSTWIKNNIQANNEPHLREEALVCSADHWFTSFCGEYKFDPSQLSKAHGACIKKFAQGLVYRRNVVCDNTNTIIAEVAPYIALAQAYDYKVRVIFIDTPPDVCIERNSKEVPAAVIERMYDQATALFDSWPGFWPDWERVPYEYE